MAVQDFTTYTEVDTNNHLSQDTNTSTFAGLTCAETCYLYKDFSADYFDGDFTQEFTFYLDNQTSVGFMCPWMMGIDLGDYSTLVTTGTHYFLCNLVMNNGGTRTYYAIECDGGNVYSDSYTTFELDTLYYIRVKRDESVGTYGTFYTYIYSDAAHINLIDTLSVTLHTAKRDHRYLLAPTSFNNGGAPTSDGYIEDLKITGFNMQINISDVWKDVSEIKINIGDSWKTVTATQINIGDTFE